ncbi:Rrf2 family transcriptional regulator [Deltaproteobacteria bacterium Smac51]|nr:Rrf2 family transcriptional regulator [Deltaproteobacteria bacterium Smac51]
MRISTKGRYSLRILLDLARHRDDGYIPLKTIAEREGISKKYLDQIMLILNRTVFSKSTRGAQGGYKLAKAPAEYTLGDILRLTEGSISRLVCLENNGEDSPRSSECTARCVWGGLEKVMTDYLDNMTLQDMLNQHDTILQIHQIEKK